MLTTRHAVSFHMWLGMWIGMGGLLNGAGCKAPGVVVHLAADSSLHLDSYCVGLSASGTRRYGHRYAVSSDPLPQSLGVKPDGQSEMNARLEGRVGGVRVASVNQANVSLSGGGATLSLGACIPTGSPASVFHMRDSEPVGADALAFVHTGLETQDAPVLVTLGKANSAVLGYNDGRPGVQVLPAVGETVHRVLVTDVSGVCADDLLVAADALPLDEWADSTDDVTDVSFNSMMLSSDMPTDIAVGDLDGDAWADIVQVGATGGTVLIASGSGTYVAHDGFASAEPTGAQAVAIGNLDSDTAPDIIVGFSGSSATQISWYQNDGSGKTFDLTGTSTLLSPDGTPTYDATKLVLTDLDHDGALDVLAATSIGLRVFLNDGKGSFTDMTSTWVPATIAVALVDVVVADVDGDCIDDVLVAGATTPPHVLGVGAGALTDRGTIGASIAHAVGAADLDGAGIPSIVLLYDDAVAIWAPGGGT